MMLTIIINIDIIIIIIIIVIIMLLLIMMTIMIMKIAILIVMVAIVAVSERGGQTTIQCALLRSVFETSCSELSSRPSGFEFLHEYIS